MITDIKQVLQAKREAERAINRILREFTEDTNLNIAEIEVDIVGHSHLADDTKLNFVGVRLEVRL